MKHFIFTKGERAKAAHGTAMYANTLDKATARRLEIDTSKIITTLRLSDYWGCEENIYQQLVQDRSYIRNHAGGDLI